MISNSKRTIFERTMLTIEVNPLENYVNFEDKDEKILMWKNYYEDSLINLGFIDPIKKKKKEKINESKIYNLLTFYQNNPDSILKPILKYKNDKILNNIIFSNNNNIQYLIASFENSGIKIWDLDGKTQKVYKIYF